MLFLPQSVYDARASLWRDLQAGKIIGEQAYRRMLELDPDDHIGLMGLGRLRREAGDLAAAEQYFWQAIQAHPCMSHPYLELSRTLFPRPESAALALAVGELGIAKSAPDDETFSEGPDLPNVGLGGTTLEEFTKLEKATQARLMSTAMRAERDHEPETVTGQLRQFRLIHQVQEDGDLDRETVDAIIGEGESIAPLLVGVMRGWAQNLLGEDGDSAVENALGLLGETGSASEIPHLLEFVDLDHLDVAGAACWALGRIVERHPEESAQLVASIAAGLGTAERIAVAEQILRHPGLDPAGKLLERLSQNLESMKKEERDAFFPALLGTMAAARGREGVNLGFKVLRQQGGLLTRNTRLECEGLLTALQLEGVSAVRIKPSPVTVYEICEGNAIFGDDDDEGEEEELEDEILPVPEPVRRSVTPGRNDPCWCKSGKKYKKCHLDSDERARHSPREQAAVPRGSNEFEGLRKRIGEFLGEVLTDREKKLALDEFFGGGQMDDKGAAISVMDWILHDWVAPSLGRTVMEEFLIRRGSRITQREREMVEAWTRSFVGLYEVQELTAGVGLKLKDLIFGETFFVHDMSMSTQLARWDGLLTRVVPGERGTELAGIGLTVPRHGIGPLREWMEDDRRNAGLEWREYLKGNWPRIRRRSFEIAANWRESVRLANSDGEELLFSKAVYGIIDEAAVIAGLRNCPAFHAEDGHDFVWLDERRTVLGNIRAGRDELVLECNSRQRLERGKRLLSNIAGKSLRHLRDEFTTQKELRSRAAAGHSGVRPDEKEMPEEVREQVASYLEDHYRQWLDMKLPALDGNTPRKAMRTVQGRKQVIAVLKDIENGEDRKRQAGEPFYDVTRLRVELGLDS
jgi:hypothetical protein